MIFLEQSQRTQQPATQQLLGYGGWRKGNAAIAAPSSLDVLSSSNHCGQTRFVVKQAVPPLAQGSPMCTVGMQTAYLTPGILHHLLVAWMDPKEIPDLFECCFFV